MPDDDDKDDGVGISDEDIDNLDLGVPFPVDPF